MKKYFFSLALLMAGSGLFATDKNSEMQSAIFAANLYKVRELIGLGCDVNIASCGGYLPVNAAIVLLRMATLAHTKLINIIEKTKQDGENYNYKAASKITYRYIKPSLDKIEKDLFNLSEIGIELLNHGSKIKKDLSEDLEQITCHLCPKKEVCLLCPPQKKQPSFCQPLYELDRKYKQRLAEQEKQKLENIEKTEKN